MSPSHAVIWMDHERARVLHLDSATEENRTIRAHHHYTRQHASGVRTEHEFFAQVCDALDGVSEVLVTASGQVQAAYRHYVGKHRPALEPRIAGWETVDHPSDAELIALAKKYFVRHDRMKANAVPR